jgi:septal ring factor EnvC (AmiA/AmiB activator)
MRKTGSGRSRVFTMVDASFSRQRHQEDRAVVGGRRLRVLAAALAVILIGVGCAVVWGFFGRSVAALPPSANAVPVPAREQVADEILETARGLQVTQQQAVDQLQVVQDQLAAQKAETKKLSEQIGAVAEKLEALQRSVADIPAPPAAAPVSPPKPRHQ